MFQTNVLEDIKIHISYSLTFYENRAVYMRMWKNITQRGRPQMIIWRMCIACWIPKAINTVRICNIFLLFHCNNGYKNAPRCSVIRTLPVLFTYTPRFLVETPNDVLWNSVWETPVFRFLLSLPSRKWKKKDTPKC